MMKKLFFSISAAAVILVFSACSKTDSPDFRGPGRLVIKITDAPFPVDMVESATVTITKVEVRKVCDSISDGNPFIVVSEDTMTFNLLDLRNGITDDLAEIEVPAGKYDLVRLYVDEAGLKIKDGDSYNVKVPSGRQTGIKIFISPALSVQGGLTSELLLDFDLSNSFVMRGNLHKPSGINGFIFKPVIRAVNNSTAGRIEGMVTDTLKVKIKEATVWIKKDTTVATTIADTLGHYALIGIPAGTYSIFATKVNYDTVSFTGIKVTAGNRTIQNFQLTKK
jgi:hypothetical protein